MVDQVEFDEPIAVRTVRHGDALVIQVEGEVGMDTCDQVRAEVVERLEERPGTLVLDLNGVEVFGSIGLSLLVEVRHRAEARGVPFAVAAGRRVVLRPLTDTGVADLLVLRPEAAEAVVAAREAGRILLGGAPRGPG
ncbi:STAS domain-containing protein [Saccharothrix xinjiangensis]|uniref:Anti-sigma factor antagonist n=1 Tax=Saccharothrix xinjiangensis TaxID=204798 RepID=A0ABV9XV38_9PSEU